MEYILLGVIGFVAGYLSDMVSLRRIPGLKQFLVIAAGGLLGYSLLMVCLSSEGIVSPVWSSWLGWALLPASALLLVYSLFIELPFKKTYTSSDPGQELVRTGTYALVRHPGVLWYALLLFSLILISRSRLLLIASPLWISMDVLWVILQERFVFGKIFEGYESYKNQTPMLVPNRKSIGACLRSLKQTRAESGA